MESMINPSLLNGSTYIIVNQDLVEDLGHAFMPLTGYSKADFYHEDIAVVLRTLFGYVFDPGQDSVPERYLFKKSKEVIEVQVGVYEFENARKLYLFRHNKNFILSSELSLVHHLMKDNYLGVGVFSSTDYRLLRANRLCLDFMQDAFCAGDKLVGNSLNEIIPDFCGSVMEIELQNICRNGKTVHLNERPVICVTGSVKYWNHTIIPISEGDRVRFIVFILEDVTDLTLKGKRMEEKNEELKKTIEMKDEMLMLITHEMKTPLSIISSSVQAVEVICKNELSDKVRKYLNKIRQNSYRQLKLVNNILDNTRVTSGLFRVNKTNIDIVELTKTIIETITVYADHKKIKIFFFSEVEKLILTIDMDIYERILLNLLSNAVKFTPEGNSIEVNIIPLSLKGRRQISIQVRDNGVGIPSDQKDLIFERFGRVNRHVSRHSEGTGIGLYLVKTLVSLLDGNIKVDSEEGKGSTFTLFFPLSKSNGGQTESADFEISGDRLLNATNIEFSDVYY